MSGLREGTAEKLPGSVLFTSSGQESNPSENPYHDNEEGAILTYTGTGKFGDQNLTGPNLRVSQQHLGYYPIYVFALLKHRKSAGSPEKRWRFSGIYKYLDHGRQNQADLLGLSRDAWVFKLLKLPILESHPGIESQVSKIVAGAFADPLLSPRALLGEALSYPASEIHASLREMEAMSPTEFEHFIGKSLVASRFREVRVTKQSADGGVDVVARMPLSVWPVERQIIQIQAKRWQRPVGRREIAELRGSLIPQAIGVMITTGNYAKTAITEAGRPHQMPVSLIDGHKLAIIRMDLKMTED